MIKKILRYLLLVGAGVFVYFNYIKEPEKLEGKKDNLLITSSVSYNVDDYYITADKQINNLKENINKFEKAKALFEEMSLYGDNAFINKERTLYLDTNILGIGNNGWKIKGNNAKYDSENKKVVVTNKIEAFNEEEGIRIYGDSLTTDIKLNNLNLERNIKISTERFELYADYAHYNNETKKLKVWNNVKIKEKSLETLGGKNHISGEFKELLYNGVDKTLETEGDYTIHYGAGDLKGGKFTYYEKTNNFHISDGAKIKVEGGEIKIKELNYIESENKMHFIGPITGIYNGYSFKADTGFYDKKREEIEILENIKVFNEESELLGDKGTYNMKNGDFHMSSKEKVTYKDSKRKIYAKDFIYNYKEKTLELLNSYTYESKDYNSRGKKFYYDENSNKGMVIEGFLESQLDGKDIKGNAKTINFDRMKEIYFLNEEVEVNYDNLIFESKKVNINNIKNEIEIEGNYIVKSNKDNMVFYGRNAVYNMATKNIKSPANIKIVQNKKIFTGYDLNYNLETKSGEIKKNIAIQTENGTKLVGDYGKFNEKSVEITGNLVLAANGIKLEADNGIYIFEDKKIYIPKKINMYSKSGIGTMENGIYDIENKKIVANNFIGNNKEQKIKGDKIIYFVTREVAQLSNNVVIEEPTIKFVGNEGEYNFLTKEIYSPKTFELYYLDYIVYGETIRVNTKTEIFDGTKVKINSTQNEEIYGDYVYGDLKNKQINLNGNTRIITYITNETGKDREAVKVRGDTVKAFLFQDKNNSLTISRIEIKGNGIYKYQDTLLHSDYLELDLLKNLAFGKKNNHINIGKDIDITSDIVNMDLTKEVITLIGDVTIESIDINNEKIDAVSNKGVLYNKEKKIILEDNVIVNTKTNSLKADYGEYYLDTGVIDAKGNIKLDYKQ